VSADFGEQLTFSGLEPKPQRKSSRNSTAGAPKITADKPVASVLVEKLPIHLDQLFDYLVPEKFADIAVPGAAVKVPFGNQQLDGYIAEYYAGSVADVVRLAVPPRHATTEKAFIAKFLAAEPLEDDSPDTPAILDTERISAHDESAWGAYTAGRAFVERLSAWCADPSLGLPRAVWSALPGYGLSGGADDRFHHPALGD
jgi:primosomal protein N' (replication factor Y)